jgi:thiol-disulfide isomerase/thioredoxin
MSKLSDITVEPKKFKNSLVFYYWLSCPYCVNFTPTYMRFVREASNKYPHLQLLAVDIHKSAEKLQKMKKDIPGVPYVVLYDSRGKETPLNANSEVDRTVSKLHSFVQTHMRGISGGKHSRRSRSRSRSRSRDTKRKRNLNPSISGGKHRRESLGEHNHLKSYPNSEAKKMVRLLKKLSTK